MRIIVVPHWLDRVMNDNGLSYQSLLTPEVLNPYLSKKDWFELHTLQQMARQYFHSTLGNSSDEDVWFQSDACLGWLWGLSYDEPTVDSALMDVIARDERRGGFTEQCFGLYTADTRVGFTLAETGRFLEGAEPVVVIRAVAWNDQHYKGRWEDTLRVSLLQLSYETGCPLADVSQSHFMTQHLQRLTSIHAAQAA